MGGLWCQALNAHRRVIKVARKSSIAQLSKDIQSAVGKAIKDGRLTIDQIHDLVEQMGGEVSRSAVGRYVKKARDQMQMWQEAQGVAKVWADKIDEESDSDVHMLVSQMLRVVGFQAVGAMDAETAAKDIADIAKALKDLATSDKLQADRILSIRREAAKEAAIAVEKAADEIGITPQAKKQIREIILGAA